ncbi:hypothetical protein Leucomu_05680 [Leucobacter muris]|uniref:DUF4355 domain-containing protein n=1 Tax=Leucobacter muris TaxID=1935379 RepID=A0ABX5QEN6_9MICO|nr:hypothetical protein [Leucobacter muris]QAB17478.1 hypothetical protein Leucomu_05680 [Leucobacter muris]
MSKTVTTNTQTTTEPNGAGEGSAAEPNGDAEPVDYKAKYEEAIGHSRTWEQRAKDNKAAADELTQLKEAQKTDEQKRQEREAERDRELAELKAEKLRAEVAEAKSDPEKGIHVPAKLLRGSTREELEASADELIKFKGDPAEKQRVVVRREATAGANSKTNPAREAKRGWLQSLLGDND